MFTINTKNKSSTRVSSKKIKLSFLISLIVLSLISCEKKELNSESNENQNVAIFTSTIKSFILEFAKTRVVGTTWHEQDAIGIYAINSQQEVNEESIYNDYSNIKYINAVSGEIATFSAADNKIILPVNDQALDFIAYYPYTPNVTGFTFPIDITFQEARTDINIMYAISTGHTSANSDVEFKFQRVLSSIVIYISSKEGINLQDATITIENANTNAILSLVDGTISVGQEKNAITPIIENDTTKNEIITKATLLPGQELSDLDINIKLANGDEYSWTPDDYELTSQVARCYELNLTYHDVELINSGSTIDGWEYDRDETVHNLKPVPKDITEDPIDPEDENPDTEALGDGTQENPYTIHQAIAAGRETAWVTGYIVGYAVKEETGIRLISDDFSHKDALLNVVIANNLLENDEKFLFPIQLTVVSQTTKNELNLKENEHLLGRRVKIRCFLPKYLGVPGGLDATDYELLAEE